MSKYLFLLFFLTATIVTGCGEEPKDSDGEGQDSTIVEDTMPPFSDVPDVPDGNPDDPFVVPDVRIEVDLSKPVPCEKLRGAFMQRQSEFIGKEVTVEGWFSNISFSNSPPSVQFSLYPAKDCHWEQAAAHFHFSYDKKEEFLKIPQYVFMTIRGTVEGGLDRRPSLVDCEILGWEEK